MNIKVKLSLKGNLTHFGKNAGDVVTVPFEDYVKAVVASEIANAPLEACKALAVAARSFAWPSARDGKVITDTGANDQAFIAARMTNKTAYPNAHQGAEETAGQILTYQDKPIGKTAYYSSANNGSTKNRRYKWPSSSDLPYLVMKPDSWTCQELLRREAQKERIRYGHGVGLSQYGAMYAARNGIGYRAILEFYYPGTKIESISGTEEKTGGGTMAMTQADILVQNAKGAVGGAYVFAALGESCTPGNREKYAKRKPAHAAAIRKGCQVLSGKKGSCAGCRYKGKRIFDCRGLTSVMLKETTGRYLKGGGATSQWNNDSNWVEKGPLSTMPDKPCVLFNRSKKDSKVMSHTGLHIGGEKVIQAGGYGGTGVHLGPLHKKHWTHWAIPALLYEKGKGGETMKLLARGSSGAAVKELQEGLSKLNYTFKATKTDPRGIDGIYGADTESKVKLFQTNNGLAVDGVWKEKDQKMLDKLLAEAEKPEKPEEQPDEQANVSITIPKDTAKALAEALKGVV